jgi:mannose-6-phosphate isomerase-like protein (cupin superfamily)
MSNADRSRVLHLSEARARIPGPGGEHAVSALQHGTLDVALSIPAAPIRQTPHTQDEVYVVVRGRGFILHDGERDPFEVGDLLFVAAGIEHQFEDLSDDFAVWRMFYGRQGGEVPIAEVM